MAMAAAAYLSSASAILLYAALFFAGALAEPGATKVATSEVPSTLPVCKTVGGGSTFFDVQFCQEALGSDGRSANAGTNYGTYSVIATDLLTANATSTAIKIDGLLRERAGKDDDALPPGVPCAVRRRGARAARLRSRRQGQEGRRGLEVPGGSCERGEEV